MDYNNIGFRNKDVNYITSKASYTSSNGMSRFRRDTISTTPDGSSASKSKLKKKNGKETSVFKQINLTASGGTVLKNRNEKSSERNISREAAERKIKRLQRRQQRMM
jgi:hypothetical protein